MLFIRLTFIRTQSPVVRTFLRHSEVLSSIPTVQCVKPVSGVPDLDVNIAKSCVKLTRSIKLLPDAPYNNAILDSYRSESLVLY